MRCWLGKRSSITGSEMEASRDDLRNPPSNVADVLRWVGRFSRLGSIPGKEKSSVVRVRPSVSRRISDLIGVVQLIGTVQPDLVR